MTVYYFDVLPLHPEIESFESLTSYLTRVCQQNRIQSIDILTILLFPEQHSRVVRGLRDFPPVTIDALALKTNQTRQALLATTFFYVGHKFARSTDPQTISRFLTGMIAPHYRYCPQCLAMRRYSSLLWRFKYLVGCVEHRQYLVSECPHCDTSLPVWHNTVTFEPTRCRHCQRDITQAAPKQLSLQDLDHTQQWHDLLAFLLRPWQFGNNPVMVKRLGNMIAATRQQLNVSAQEAAAQANITLHALRSIEQGNTERGASLQSYIAYADLLGCNLSDLFQAASQVTHEPDPVVLATEAALKHAIQAADSITFKSIALKIGMPPSTLRAHREAATKVRQAKAQQADRERRQIIAEVRAAVRVLGPDASSYRVADYLGISRAKLRQIPEAIAIINDARG